MDIQSLASKFHSIIVARNQHPIDSIEWEKLNTDALSAIPSNLSDKELDRFDLELGLIKQNK